MMKTEEVSNKGVQASAAAATSSFWRRRGVVTTSVVLSLLGAGVSVAPVVLTATSLRNRLLNSAVPNEQLTATAEAASGGWLAPLSFRDVRIADADGALVWTVKEMQTTKGLLSFITDPAEVGEIRLSDSSLKARLTADGKWPIESKSRPSNSNLSFRVENGSLEVSVPWRDVPIIELSDLTIAGNIGLDSNGRRMLHVEPIHVLDHAPISESNTQQNLALIAPVLSQSTTLSGTASVWLDEINLPLDEVEELESSLSSTPESDTGVADDFPIHGRAEFHTLEARLKENWIRQLMALIGQVGNTEMPNQIQVLKDSNVRFSVSKEGISHDGMVFLLPQLAEGLTFVSSGIVRLDERLDLLLTLQLPKIMPAGRPFLSLLAQITEAPIQVRVAGTVSEPKLQLPEGTNLLSSLTGQIAPAQHTQEAPPLPSAVMDLIQSVGNQDREQVRKDLPGNIFNLIRAVESQAKQKREGRKPRKK
jgi:hypothetical protein